MVSVLRSLTVAAADQEKVDPSIDVIANVCSSVRGVRRAYIDGWVKETYGSKLIHGWWSVAKETKGTP